MANNNFIEIRLSGEGILPENVRAKDLAEVLEAVEDMIVSLIVHDNPHMKKEEIIIGLVNVSRGSVHLEFSPQLPGVVIPAYEKIARAIHDSDFRGLPSGSVESLQKMSSFTRRHNCNLELRAKNGQSQVLAVISSDLVIEPVPWVTGPTTVYGRVLRVGGKTKPTVMLELLNGSILYCSTQLDLAKRLGERLYTWVGLHGIAHWDPSDFAIRKFTIEYITPYEDTPISQAMAALSKIANEFYKDIDDVNGYVTGLREA